MLALREQIVKELLLSGDEQPESPGQFLAQKLGGPLDRVDIEIGPPTDTGTGGLKGG
jgi:hypothetical protein